MTVFIYLSDYLFLSLIRKKDDLPVSSPLQKEKDKKVALLEKRKVDISTDIIDFKAALQMCAVVDYLS